ncbi:MAG: hypothetical protein M3315_16090 [Actinomycetota bacterium]|nr:hypothetical protein [Actinomycetota bacterium]
MLKKVIVLTSILALVLASAQLALAQQDTQPATPPGGASQAALLDPSPQSMIPDTSPTSASQAAGNNHNGLMHLNADNELVVNCQALSDRLATLQQAGDTQTADPQLQSEVALAEGLLQLCQDKGFTPVDSGSTATPSTSSPSDAGSTQPQQGGSTPSPANVSSAEPHQTEEGQILT